MGRNIQAMTSSAVMYARNKFSLIPVWLWVLQIVITSFFTMFFFAVMADYVNNPDLTVRYVVIGNMVQSIAATTLFSVADIPGTEKHTGMLSSLVQSPASLFSIFMGMSMLNILSGLISATLSLCYAQFIFGIDLSAANFLSIAVIFLLTTLSLTGLGMAVGSVGLRLRTSTIIANIVSYIGLLICGVNFPISYLPEWVQFFSYLNPLTYAVNATRGAADGMGIAEISGDLTVMVILGAAYLLISFILFSVFEKRMRDLGLYDSF